ncbi:MAG TPA: DUF4153 domain-containing protein [Allosphingosinicella sp.]|jgi:hypothetical protein
MTDRQQVDHGPWPERALLLAALGGACGFLFYHLTSGMRPGMWTDQPLRMAAAAFVVVGGILVAFSLERLRWTWTLAFAAGGAAIVSLVTAWNGTPAGWGADEGWQFFASLIAVAVAVPLFQAARDAGGRRFDTAAVHGHVWTNVILGGAALAFTGASLLLILLLAELFSLIGVDVLRRLMERGWFQLSLVGTAFGGAVGLLRDRDSVLGTLQKVARAILSVLAPVLAAGLLLFVLALPFTGLEPLWSKTKSTTPLLLLCVVAAVVLVNATTGNSEEEEARSPLLRWSGVALIAVMLPLIAVAAVSLGKRIGQYGYTPERLWAAVFVIVAASAALGYLLSLIRGRLAWPSALRRTNVRLAAGICLLALFLASPILSFGSVSAHDQLARLRDGRTPPERFDWAAMRFDFGPAGRKALEQLAASGPAPLRARAVEWLKAEERYALTESTDTTSTTRPVGEPRLIVEPSGSPIPQPLKERIGQAGLCGAALCRLIVHGNATAILVVGSCDTCPPHVLIYRQEPEGGWTDEPPPPPRVDVVLPAQRPSDTPPQGRIEVRTIEKQQVFVDGKPVGPLFD